MRQLSPTNHLDSPPDSRQGLEPRRPDLIGATQFGSCRSVSSPSPRFASPRPGCTPVVKLERESRAPTSSPSATPWGLSRMPLRFLRISTCQPLNPLATSAYHAWLADPDLALPFLTEARNREHDELLVQKPGWNRGIPY